MNVIEYILSHIAPHACVQCGAEGSLLCDLCSEALPPSLDCCAVCNRLQPDGSTCPGCQAGFPLSHVVAGTPYKDSAKLLVQALKYERSATAARDIARVIVRRLPLLPATLIVTHLPTAYPRMRQRGYDQSALIAREVARHVNRAYAPLLYRFGGRRQVGQDRTVRAQQLNGAFRAAPRAYRGQQPILLIDDVLTTGSSLTEAAKVLREAGISDVWAAVFARA